MIHRELKSLKIKISTNIKLVDFLDITLDQFSTLMENNVNTSYIHPDSNQTLSVIQYIPSFVQRKIINHSLEKMCLINIAVSRIKFQRIIVRIALKASLENMKMIQRKEIGRTFGTLPLFNHLVSTKLDHKFLCLIDIFLNVTLLV